MSYASNWIKESERLTHFQEQLKNRSPVITRYLSQRELHQLSTKLAEDQLEGDIILILVHDFAFTIKRSDQGWAVTGPSFKDQTFCKKYRMY